MRYRIRIKGIRPLIMHNGVAGLDTRSPANLEKAEITRKRGSNRTESDDARLRELECQISLYLDADGAPTLPEGMIKAVIERSARKLKQGTQVREGMIVEQVEEFSYDRSMGTTAEALAKTAQFTTGVVVQRNRVLRTRAKFDEWGVTFIVEADDELVDQSQLETWLDIAGRRIGVGDWRPEKSGVYGRFETESIEALPD